MTAVPGILEIDLAALSRNYATVRTRAAGADVAAAVKANAYGLGVGAVAPALAEAGCHTFFVATMDEGVELRSICPGVAIYVLNGLMPGDEAACSEFRLIPCLNDLGQVARWRAHGTGKACIHVDTGMNRLGMSPGEAEQFAAAGKPTFELALVMSHLACAKHPSHPLNAVQLERFKAVRRLFPATPFSLANSAGVFLGPDYVFDMPRVGIALFGGNPTESPENPMEPVVRLQVCILQERHAVPGETVGYDALHILQRPSRLVTIAAGYADGIATLFTNRGHAVIGGRKVPMVGRVSMDMIVLDVTGVPEALTRPGMIVDILGADQTLDDLAPQGGLISYELLTGFGSRFERRYIET